MLNLLGKDDMSNIKLVAGRGESQADKRVNVWIEQGRSCHNVGTGALRIMTQVDGIGSPKCIGTIEQSNLVRAANEPCDALLFNFPEQKMFGELGVNTAYLVRSGDNCVVVNVAV